MASLPAQPNFRENIDKYKKPLIFNMKSEAFL